MARTKATAATAAKNLAVKKAEKAPKKVAPAVAVTALQPVSASDSEGVDLQKKKKKSMGPKERARRSLANMVRLCKKVRAAQKGCNSLIAKAPLERLVRHMIGQQLSGNYGMRLKASAKEVLTEAAETFVLDLMQKATTAAKRRRKITAMPVDVATAISTMDVDIALKTDMNHALEKTFADQFGQLEAAGRRQSALAFWAEDDLVQLPLVAHEPRSRKPPSSMSEDEKHEFQSKVADGVVKLLKPKPSKPAAATEAAVEKKKKDDNDSKLVDDEAEEATPEEEEESSDSSEAEDDEVEEESHTLTQTKSMVATTQSMDVMASA